MLKAVKGRRKFEAKAGLLFVRYDILDNLVQNENQNSLFSISNLTIYIMILIPDRLKLR